MAGGESKSDVLQDHPNKIPEMMNETKCGSDLSEQQ
jgi:hypothetical protein